MKFSTKKNRRSIILEDKEQLPIWKVNSQVNIGNILDVTNDLLALSKTVQYVKTEKKNVACFAGLALVLFRRTGVQWRFWTYLAAIYGTQLSYIFKISSIANEKPSISIEIPSILIEILGFVFRNFEILGYVEFEILGISSEILNSRYPDDDYILGYCY